MEGELKQTQLIRCKECQFFRDNGDYQWCVFWTMDDEALTEPDGYCHNAVWSDPSTR